jgi:excisionase family DNA binding protein
MMSNDFIMTVSEAAKMTGYSKFMILRFCHRGEFSACMPRGKRGGYEIVRPAFEQWWQAKRAAAANRKEMFNVALSPASLKWAVRRAREEGHKDVSRVLDQAIDLLRRQSEAGSPLA